MSVLKESTEGLLIPSKKLYLGDTDIRPNTISEGSHTVNTVAAAWEPDSLSSVSLVLWLDAQDYSTITESGGAVSAWNDKSASGWHATQATPSLQPNYDAAYTNLNGNPAIGPSVDGQKLAFAAQVMIDDWTFDGRSGFDINLYGQKASVGAAPQGGIYAAVWENLLNGGSNIFWKNGTNLSSYFAGSNNQTPAAGGVMLVTYANSAGQNNLGKLTSDDNPVYLFNRAAGERGYDGYLGELIRWDGTISTLERQKLEGYLAHKWGYAADLPSSHPYKSAAPQIDLWTPANLSSGTIDVWLDAQSSSSITKDASNLVSEWADLSGNANHASQATAANQPLYTAANASVNGYPTISPQDSSDYLVFPSKVIDYLWATDTGGALSLWAETTNFGGYPFGGVLAGIWTTTANGGGNIHWHNGVQKSASFTEASPVPSSPGAAFVVGSINGGGSSGWGRLLSEDTPTRMFQRASGSRDINADFGEMIIITGTLSTDDRQKLEGYLAHKWGYEGSLDVAHPYKAAAPTL